MIWDLDPVLFQGPPPIRTYGVIVSVALVSAFLLFRWQMLRAGHPDEVSGWFLGWGLAGVIGGARVGHCLVYDLPATIANPLLIFLPWQGGLSSHGALLGLVAALWIYAKRHRVGFADAADRLTFGGALAVVLVRLANFLNSEIVGRPTQATWGVRFLRWDGPSAPLRHPVQLYEAAVGLVLLFVIFGLDRRLGERRPVGLLSAILLCGYFGVRLVLEHWKEPEGLPSSTPITLGQILSVAPAIAGAVWLIIVLRRMRSMKEVPGV